MRDGAVGHICCPTCDCSCTSHCGSLWCSSTEGNSPEGQAEDSSGRTQYPLNGTQQTTAGAWSRAGPLAGGDRMYVCMLCVATDGCVKLLTASSSSHEVACAVATSSTMSLGSTTVLAAATPYPLSPHPSRSPAHPSPPAPSAMQ